MANDYFGHEEGDDYLRAVVSLIIKNTNPEDIVCRYGGDEFIVVFLNRRENEVIELLKTANHGLHHIRKQKDKIYQRSFAFGVLEYNYQSELSFDEIMQILDARMYHNKSRSKLLEKNNLRSKEM